MEMTIWNILLTCFLGIMGFFAKSKFDELDRVAILLNKTREEVARDHVTRAEVNQTVEKLAERIDASILRLELKIDRLRED